MNIKDLSVIPSYFRDRQDSIRKLVVFPLDAFIDDYYYRILFSCNNYDQEIQFKHEFDLDSKIRIFCSCPSFNFEFANILYKSDALLYKEKFYKAIQRTPRERNTRSVLTGCKHCIACARFILNNKGHIQQLIDRKKLLKGVSDES